MIIALSNVGHRFGSNWIFKHIDQQFTPENKYAILGPNGSGKSTLLKIISGALTPSKGQVTFSNNEPVPTEDIFKSLAIATPYTELIEEYSISEFLTFYQMFKPFNDTFSMSSFLDTYQFNHVQDTLIAQYSSGMKQRLKLAVAMETKSDVLLLDEPFSNLDEQTVDLFGPKLEQIPSDRLVIIASNNKSEYRFCNQSVQLS